MRAYDNDFCVLNDISEHIVTFPYYSIVQLAQSFRQSVSYYILYLMMMTMMITRSALAVYRDLWRAAVYFIFSDFLPLLCRHTDFFFLFYPFSPCYGFRLFVG
jgi:hypothetical protein